MTRRGAFPTGIATLVLAFSPLVAIQSPLTALATICVTPAVSAVAPNNGTVDGGTQVTISGCGFTGTTGVTFTNQPATGVTVVSDTTITVVNPRYLVAPGDPRNPGEEFVTDIQVTTPAGTSPIQTSDQFSYFWPGAPCSTAALTPASPSPGATGSTILLTASTFTCTSPQYRFWVRPPGGTWHIVQDYSATNTYSWGTPSTGATGAYSLEVDVRDSFHTTVSYEKVANITYTLGGCTAAGLTASPTSPGKSGATVTFTASATCPGTPTYRYWVREPGDRWRINQEYPSSSTFNWNTTGKAYGTYGIEVDVRDQGATAAYEVVFNTTYDLVPITCSDASYGAGAIPVVTGITPNWGPVGGNNVTITGCGFTGATSVFPLAGAFTVVSDTTITTTLADPDLPIHPYPGWEDIHDIRVTTPLGTSPIQPSDLFYFFIPGGPCTSATLTASPAAPGATGSTILLTGSTFTCTDPQYRFWISPPGGSWHIVRDYSSTSTYSWTVPNTGATGTYRLEVDVRAASHAPISYERVANITYNLTGCTAANLSASPSSPQAHGTPITLTGTATCPGTPTYRFWVKAAGASWHVVQDYSTTSTFTWTPANAGTYYLEVDVRDQGATDTYEKVFNIVYSVT